MRTKFIFITGGVLSSLGKGVAAASIGAILEARGLKVNFLKFDPYINVDPGTMNPFQHGEVYVTKDGAETDLDLGHYERFTHVETSKENNYTTGQIYDSVISKERKGEYLGGTVQVIPHITDEIKSKIMNLARDDTDVVIVEVGGTVGDIESLPFLEAIRQFRKDVGKENAIYIHLTLVPFIKSAGELKTKPTQHSVKELRAIGIHPDIILCRSDRDIPQSVKEKISLFCDVPVEAVITAKDVETVYEIPIVFHQEGLDDRILEFLNIWAKRPELDTWKEVVKRILTPKREVRIGIVGKYVNFADSYKSLNEALIHGGIANNVRVKLVFVDAEGIESKGPQELLKDVDGILIPGGFGERGVEGMIAASKYARENGMPFFGICLGMQTAVIDFARNVAGLKDAHSTEFNRSTPHPVIHLVEEWFDFKTNTIQRRDINSPKGGTMRLGAYPCQLKEGSLVHKAYGKKLIFERHRHRFEFNNDYKKVLEEKGMAFVGHTPDMKLVEIVELPDHPWFVGCQFHPEFQSKPFNPHPLFRDFIKASMEKRYGKRRRRSQNARRQGKKR